MIEINNLLKSYSLQGDSLLVLNSISLSIKKGEFVALIGPSGCGKTTLLKLIAGLDTFTSGNISVLNDKPEIAIKDLTFAFNFQTPVLFPWMTIKENILLPIAINKLKYSGTTTYWENKCAELISKIGLSGFEKSYPEQLSGGMQSRVALARSLIYDPPILLMDEPFSSLDDITRYQMNVDLFKLTRDSFKTVVFVTHNIEEAILLSDRIVIFSHKPSIIKEIVSVPINHADRFKEESVEDISRLKSKIKSLLTKNF